MKKLLFFASLLALGHAARAQDPSCQAVVRSAVEPCRLEVAYMKTVHVLFPAAIRYVDLGSTNLVAGMADGAENVLRVKASVRGFEGETNFSVITADGVFYAFEVRYADDPARPTVLMGATAPQDEAPGNVPGGNFVHLQELGAQNPRQVNSAMQDIYERDARLIRNIGSKRFGVQLLCRSIHVQGDLFYFHLSVRNASNINYDVDRLRFRIADRKVAKRTALQETFIEPVRTFRPVERVVAGRTEHGVYAFRKFSIPDDKVLVVDMFERNGGRHQSFIVQNADLTAAPAVWKPKSR